MRAGRARKAVVYHRLARPQRVKGDSRLNVGTPLADMLPLDCEKRVIVTMTDSHNPEAAWNYYNATKHSYTSIRSNAHFMDWKF